jgi:hypothetical protein
MKNFFILASLALLPAATAFAQETAPYTIKPYELTESDAAAINARRPTSWSPSHVSVGDVYEIDSSGDIIIPTLERRSCANCAEVVFEDLEPPTTTATK